MLCPHPSSFGVHFLSMAVLGDRGVLVAKVQLMNGFVLLEELG
jgi:hypothetical protein